MIYLDSAATTSVSEEVLKAMKPYFTDNFGNPSSIYKLGRDAGDVLEESREKAAEILGAKSREIIFTSGATEANNLTLKGVAFRWSQDLGKSPHIIISAVEHHSVLDTADFLEKKFGFEVTKVGVNEEGIINLGELKEAIKENTAIVSIVYGNNEAGSIQPIKEISKTIKEKNKNRDERIVFHTDAVQAFQYLPCKVDDLGVDMLSLTAHKFYGPKGVGLLYVKSGIKFLPMQQGGAQERKRRAGTENVPLIVGMVEAMEKAKKEDNKKIEGVSGYLIKRVIGEIDDVVLTGPAIESGKRLPHIASFIFKKIEGESILINLDMKGIYASSGSACTSGSLESSHVLTAMGYDDFQAHGSIRFSIGNMNEKSDVDELMRHLPKIVAKLRKISPIK